MPQIKSYNQEEWLRILGKGMITIPKSWREQFGFQPGSIIKAEKYIDKIVIKPFKKPVSYRVYSKKELNQFLKDDQLSAKSRQKLDRQIEKI